MNKLIKFILSMTLVFSSLVMLQSPIVTPVDVQADVTSLACGTQYEVAIANTNGTFTKMSCHNSFSDAQNTMWGYGDDAVVRHHASKSPMKIVAMSTGLAITYPMRSGSSTMNITQDVSHQYRKVTYVTKHREMRYEGTYSYNGSGNGTIKVNITGFSGTADLVNVDLVPYAFVGGNVTMPLGGNDTSAANEQPFWTRIYQTYYTVSNGELTFVAHSGWSGNGWPEKYSLTVGLAAEWMTNGTTYYSYDGYNFYSDAKYRNKVGTYYNYYQFLPSRTKTNIPASVFDSFLLSIKPSGSAMQGQGQTFIDAQNTYGMNALLVYSLACLESAYGTSNYALQRNNLFGWNAFDSNPGSASYFKDIPSAINEHMGINLRGYTNIEDSRFFGSHVGNKGSGFNVKYAADPYWGYKIAAIAYSIDKKAGFADLNKYSVGVINTYGVNVLKSPGGATLFNSAYGATYQENFTVAILGNESNHYKIQSTNPLSSGNIVTGTTKGLVSYDWNGSVGYIPTNYVSITGNSAPVQPSGTTPTGDFVNTITSATFKDGSLIIEGNAYRPGIYVTDKNTIKQTLIINDNMFNKTEMVLTSTVTDNDKVKYAGTIDLSKLTKGDYYFRVRSEYGVLTDYNQEILVEKLEKYPEEIILNNVKYKLYAFGDMVKLSVGQTSVTPNPTPTPPAVVKKELIHELSKFDRTDNMLNIEGIAFITGIDAKEDSSIKHEVYFLNLETKETIPFEVETQSIQGSISMGDGYTYTKVKFVGKFDISQLNKGNYVLYIKVTEGSDEKRAEVVNYYNNMKPTDLDNISFLINTGFNYRYEMRYESAKIDYSVIKKPSNNASVFDFFKINTTDASFTIDGIAWINDTDTIKSKNPFYKLLLVNETGEVIEKTMTNKPCKVDYGKNSNYKFSTIDACFEGSFTLTDIPNGTYNLLLDFGVGEYRNIIELYDYLFRANSTVELNGKKYEIKVSPVRSRLILLISNIGDEDDGTEGEIPANIDESIPKEDLPNNLLKSNASPLTQTKVE